MVPLEDGNRKWRRCERIGMDAQGKEWQLQYITGNAYWRRNRKNVQDNYARQRTRADSRRICWKVEHDMQQSVTWRIDHAEALITLRIGKHFLEPGRRAKAKGEPTITSLDMGREQGYAAEQDGSYEKPGSTGTHGTLTLSHWVPTR